MTVRVFECARSLTCNADLTAQRLRSSNAAPLHRCNSQAVPAWLQLELGECYLTGIGVRVDYAEAVRLFSSAAKCDFT